MDDIDSQTDFFGQNQDIIASQYEPFEPAAQQIVYSESSRIIENKNLRINALLISNIRNQERLINTLSKQSQRIDKRIADIETKIVASSELIESQNKEIKLYLQEILTAVNVLLGKREIRLQNDKERRTRKKQVVSTKISEAKNKLHS
jgi:hypothetical protein